MESTLMKPVYQIIRRTARTRTRPPLTHPAIPVLRRYLPGHIGISAPILLAWQTSADWHASPLANISFEGGQSIHSIMGLLLIIVFNGAVWFTPETERGA